MTGFSVMIENIVNQIMQLVLHEKRKDDDG